MIFLLLGGLTLAALMWALGMFSGAPVKTIKSFGIWFVVFGGLALAALLFFSGRGAAAIGDLMMLGMLIWPWIKQQRHPGRGSGAGGSAPRSGRSGMTREEAIRDAHKRLMRMAHPDNGGSDWLASRLNQARDTLLA